MGVGLFTDSYVMPGLGAVQGVSDLAGGIGSANPRQAVGGATEAAGAYYQFAY